MIRRSVNKRHDCVSCRYCTEDVRLCFTADLPGALPAKLIPAMLLCRSHALDSRHSAAVLHYMLEVLPQLHDNSSCPAASLLIHILTSSAAPGPLLQSATALLNNLPLHNKSPAAPLGGQVQLACELLALFTAEAFQALSKSRGTAAKAAKASVDAGLEVLLYLLRFGLDCASSEEQAAKALKLAAYQQLGAELYAVMPVQQQMEAFLVRSSLTICAPASLLPLCQSSATCYSMDAAVTVLHHISPL